MQGSVLESLPCTPKNANPVELTSDGVRDITARRSYPQGSKGHTFCCIAGHAPVSITLLGMRSAELLSSLPQQPTIFFHDSDEQLLLWLQHARTMRVIEGRWQGAWNVFAAAAETECKRRNLGDCIHTKQVS